MTTPRPAARHAGFSLVIVLVFMLVLSMIGITGMQASGLQERMASHSRDRSISLQAAEATLRAAEEQTLMLDAFAGDASCTQGICATGSAPNPHRYAWDDTKSVMLDPNDASLHFTPELAGNPRYYIEFAGVRPTAGAREGTTLVFRVTAHSSGLTPQTATRLQSTYAH